MRPLGEQIVGAPRIAGKIVRIEALVLRRGEDFPAEHGVEESLLVPEMDIKHRLADTCSRRDPVNSCPRQPVLGKFPQRSIQQHLLGLGGTSLGHGPLLLNNISPERPSSLDTGAINLQTSW